MSLCPGLGRRAGKVRVTGNQPMDQEPRSGSLRPTHFLFIAGALRERSSQDSAQLQLGHGLWGIRSVLIEKNLSQYLSDHSRGLVYVLKVGLCAEFEIRSRVLPFAELDDLAQDELRTETRFGFVRLQLVRRWESSADASFALLQRVLEVPDRAELTRRLNLGMHGLSQAEYEAMARELGEGLSEPD